jgi:hypothetical protein
MKKQDKMIVVCLAIISVVALAVSAFADRKVTSGGDVMAKDVLSQGGGLSANLSLGTMQSSVGQEVTGRSATSGGEVLIGGYLNAWRPLGGGELIMEYTFDTAQGWSTTTFTGFTLPTYSGPSGGRIGITGPVGGFVFGFWQTAGNVIPWETDVIYRARYALSRGAGVTPADLPQIRMRWISNNFASTADLTLSSTGSCSNVPPVTPATQEYASYLSPACNTGGFGLTFDMIDFSPEAGLVEIDRVVVEKIPRSVLGAATAVKTYSTDFNTWEFNLNFSGAFAAVSSAGSSGNFIFLGSGLADVKAGFAQSPANAMAYTTDTLVRATFTVCRTGADAHATPWVRLRAQSEDSQITACGNILHGTDDLGAAPQTPASKDFEVYWETPTLPGSPTTDEDGFRVAYDLLDFSDIEGDTMALVTVVIETFSIPAYVP